VESHFRTIIKAFSWRFIATLITFTVAWVVTKELKFAAKIGLADTLIKLGAYYFHERAWICVNFGKKKLPEYQI
jgi:adenylylsulfate kinase